MMGFTIRHMPPTGIHLLPLYTDCLTTTTIFAGDLFRWLGKMGQGVGEKRPRSWIARRHTIPNGFLLCMILVLLWREIHGYQKLGPTTATGRTHFDNAGTFSNS